MNLRYSEAKIDMIGCEKDRERERIVVLDVYQ